MTPVAQLRRCARPDVTDTGHAFKTSNCVTTLMGGRFPNIFMVFS